jgi:hypothetical protein
MCFFEKGIKGVTRLKAYLPKVKEGEYPVEVTEVDSMIQLTVGENMVEMDVSTADDFFNCLKQAMDRRYIEPPKEKAPGEV